MYWCTLPLSLCCVSLSCALGGLISIEAASFGMSCAHQGLLGEQNICPAWREWSMLLYRRCITEIWATLSQDGDVWLCCVFYPALGELLVLPSCISINWWKNDNIMLWRGLFAALRWKDTRQDTSLWVMRIRLRNTWRGLVGRRNRTGTAKNKQAN